MTGGNYLSLSQSIREKAFSLGFDLCGIAKARPLSEYEPFLKKWCDAGMNDKMTYMSRGIDKRINPDFLLPGAKSVIVTGTSYFTSSLQRNSNVPVVSRYALGMDYHDVLIPRLEKLRLYIKTIVPEAEGRAFADSAPILEKPWAVEAGLGWQGKHAIVINDKIGSFFFIGILILNTELGYDKPYDGENCGRCRACIDNCPTGAINNDRTIDSRKCIANLTIENRGPIPGEMLPAFGGRIYGCDRCQEVCPWNANAKSHNHAELDISDELAGMTREEWHSLTKEKFSSVFKGTPVARVKFARFKNNIDAVLNCFAP